MNNPDPAARVRVVAIIAQSHSGSHLLSQLLGAHSQCVSIGELHNYDKFVNRAGGDNVTSNYADDPLFAGLDGAPEQQWHERVYANARERYPTVTTLIDNSKRVSWCRKLLLNKRLHVIPVHLIRDPRAMLRHWLIRYDTSRKLRRQRVSLVRQAPLQTAGLLTCPPRELYLRKWLIDNRQATDLLARTGCEHNLVTYHDLATRSEAALRQLMPRLGLEYEAGQLRYGEAEQHGTLKRDYRDATEASRIELDVRWQSFLSASEADAVAGDARVASYLQDLGLSLTARGLTAFG